MADLVPLREARERAIARLTDLFARDELEMDEFDRRLTAAHAATTVAEVAELLADLPAPDAALATSRTALIPIEEVRDRQTVVAIFGGTRRLGQWTCPRHLRLYAVVGGATIDFREARLPSGTVDLSIVAMMGGVKIVVPPGLSVELDGTAILGGFQHVQRTPAEPDPERPVLRVRGLAVLGGVQVETRLPGENWRAARRRERRARKALRHAARRALPRHEP